MKTLEMKRILAIAACVLLLAVGCATTPTSQPAYLKILAGADAAYDAAMTACASSYNARLIGEPGKAKCIELGGYYVTARAEAVKAIELYNSTKDAAVLDQISYWTSYALGIAAQIIAEIGKAGV
jgi:hypothetical protein